MPASDQQLRLWRNSRLSSLEGVDATLSDGTLGYEWNEDLDNGSRPPGQIDLSSTTVSGPEVLQDQGSTYAPGDATHSITMHRASSGALVFDAGTVQWSWGLDGTHDRGGSTPDSAVQQATVNLFADMAVQPATLQSGLVAADGVDGHQPADGVDDFAERRRHRDRGRPAHRHRDGDRLRWWPRRRASRCRPTAASRGTPRAVTRSWSYTFTPQTTGSLTLRARATDDSVNTGPPSADVTVTVAPHGCPCTIWDNSATPALVGNNDGLPIDYGVKFRTDIDGSISGFRFYKSPGDNGTHTGHLWDTNGNLLASMTFTGETASGWQQVDLTDAGRDHGGHHVHRLDLLVGRLLPGLAGLLRESAASTIRRCTRSRAAWTDRTASTTRGRRRLPGPELQREQLLGRRRVLGRSRHHAARGHDANPDARVRRTCP